jgi:hypothetical protein
MGMRGEAIQRAQAEWPSTSMPDDLVVGIEFGVDVVLGLVCERVEALPPREWLETPRPGGGRPYRYLNEETLLALLGGGADQ